jgi:hypothetical protein
VVAPSSAFQTEKSIHLAVSFSVFSMKGYCALDCGGIPHARTTRNGYVHQLSLSEGKACGKVSMVMKGKQVGRLNSLEKSHLCARNFVPIMNLNKDNIWEDVEFRKEYIKFAELLQNFFRLID